MKDGIEGASTQAITMPGQIFQDAVAKNLLSIRAMEDVESDKT
jgi:hypothetical protein